MKKEVCLPSGTPSPPIQLNQHGRQCRDDIHPLLLLADSSRRIIKLLCKLLSDIPQLKYTCDSLRQDIFVKSNNSV